MKRSPPDGKEMQRMERLRKVRTDFLNGITSRTELSIRHGISLAMATQDVKKIMNDLRQQYKEDGLYEAELLQERVTKVYQKAVVGFERSRTDKEKVRIAYEKEKCEECNGSGFDSDEDWCGSCEGRGFVIVEKQVREVTGQAGDPNMLRVQLDCLKELARLKGLVPVGKESLINTQINVGVELPGVDLGKVSDDDLLKAVSLLQVEIEPSVEKDVIDVESKSAEEDR